MSAVDEGGYTFKLDHEHEDWATNDQGYSFGEVAAQGLTAGATKHPDKSVEIWISGPLGRSFSFRKPIPPCPEGTLHIAFQWKRPKLDLFLNGSFADTVRDSPAH